MTGQRGRIGFVLGGGGDLGAAEVGMLRALLERGILPDLVVTDIFMPERDGFEVIMECKRRRIRFLVISGGADTGDAD